MESSIRADALLFGETQSRIIVSLREEDSELLKTIASKHKVICTVIGKVKGKRLKIADKKEKRTMIDMDVASLKKSWEGGLGRFFNG